MSIRNLDVLFAPGSVAVLGASNRPNRVGSVVVRNLLQGGFQGPIMPVNPKYQAVGGILAYPDVKSLPIAPDLAVVATPPATVAPLCAELGARGTRAAVVMTAGLATLRDADGTPLDQALLNAARPHLLRVLGPNCVGLLVPGIGLNASFAHAGADPGGLAFVSQSGALCTAVLDWSRSNGIGFSHFVSLGDALDVDFGDVIDFLASDPATRAILLYIESVRDARKFLSAARAASGHKPVVAIKAGRVREGERAAASHTGALAGTDEVYEYAMRRAGILRVDTIDDLFDAVETLARSPRVRGERLVIVTNGGGPGVMATDEFVAGGGRLAHLSASTLGALDEALPANWSHGNPVDVIGDAPPERLAHAVRILGAAPEVDALLVVYAPTAVAPSTAAAAAVIDAARAVHRPVQVSWLGGESAREPRRMFADAGIASYDTPGDAVRAFLHMVGYRKGQELLKETPPSVPVEFEIDPAAARAVVEEALAEEREWLSEPEAKRALAAYGIPSVETRIARDPAEAAVEAEQLGGAVALKVLSKDILHKSDVGGVVLDLAAPDAVRRAAESMLERIAQLQPDARIDGFTVQPMARRPGAHEILIGGAVDPIFGPFVLFGQGGVAVEVVDDKAVALPPLNLHLARELLSRTRVWRLLQGFRDRKSADIDALCLCLMRISQLLVDLPEVVELDVNPLLTDHAGVLALDARMRVLRTELRGPARLAIRPYPRELEQDVQLPSGRRVLLRPIRPEDEPAHYELFEHFTPEDMRFRFFSQLRALRHAQMTRYTQIDYDREMAFIAVDQDGPDRGQTLGVVRAVADPDNADAEFAIIVRSELKGQGLGRFLLEKMIRYCRERGTGRLVGRVLADNRRMLQLARALGFEIGARGGEDVEVFLPL